jgi:hypothetical protein
MGVELRVDAAQRTFAVWLDGRRVLKQAAFAEPPVAPLERLCFRSGRFRDYDAREADRLLDESKLGDRLDGDRKVPLAVFLVDDVRSEGSPVRPRGE